MEVVGRRNPVPLRLREVRPGIHHLDRGGRARATALQREPQLLCRGLAAPRLELGDPNGGLLGPQSGLRRRSQSKPFGLHLSLGVRRRLALAGPSFPDSAAEAAIGSGAGIADFRSRWPYRLRHQPSLVTELAREPDASVARIVERSGLLQEVGGVVVIAERELRRELVRTGEHLHVRA